MVLEHVERRKWEDDLANFEDWKKSQQERGLCGDLTGVDELRALAFWYNEEVLQRTQASLARLAARTSAPTTHSDRTADSLSRQVRADQPTPPTRPA